MYSWGGNRSNSRRSCILWYLFAILHGDRTWYKVSKNNWRHASAPPGGPPTTRPLTPVGMGPKKLKVVKSSRNWTYWKERKKVSNFHYGDHGLKMNRKKVISILVWSHGMALKRRTKYYSRIYSGWTNYINATLCSRSMKLSTIVPNIN